MLSKKYLFIFSSEFACEENEVAVNLKLFKEITY